MFKWKTKPQICLDLPQNRKKHVVLCGFADGESYKLQNTVSIKNATVEIKEKN